jgi:hypothetical protein
MNVRKFFPKNSQAWHYNYFKALVTNSNNLLRHIDQNIIHTVQT